MTTLDGEQSRHALLAQWRDMQGRADKLVQRLAARQLTGQRVPPEGRSRYFQPRKEHCERPPSQQPSLFDTRHPLLPTRLMVGPSAQQLQVKLMGTSDRYPSTLRLPALTCPNSLRGSARLIVGLVPQRQQVEPMGTYDRNARMPWLPALSCRCSLRKSARPVQPHDAQIGSKRACVLDSDLV